MSRTEEIPGPGGVAAAVAEEAAGWFARLQGEAATGDDWLAFERWLQRSPTHARAYEGLERLWVDLDYAPVARDLGGRPLMAARRRRASRGSAASPGRRAWIGAGAAIAAGLAVAVGLGLWSAPGVAIQTYQTGPGQTRQIALADGTHIQLNAASKITVSLGRDARRVEMADAEAVFDVAHDTARPFLIAVGDRQVRVVGTEFNLRHRADKVALTVRRGVVEVRPADALQADPTRVTIGQMLTYTEGEAGSILKVSDPGAAFAWTSGQQIYRDQPLSEVAADLSRRFATPVRTADAHTASLRFSGVLVTDSEPEVLRRLQAFVPVRVEQTAGAVVLHSR
ncbi:FecR domain-containing protein [Phenylobacterium sp.]|uniref:FecR family protein n=1 Tax=Phenylobacterium sp. TaxID=1871053 RepID=UPI003566DA26